MSLVFTDVHLLVLKVWVVNDVLALINDIVLGFEKRNKGNSSSYVCFVG